MNVHGERIEALRQKMNEAGIGLYYVPMSDCHASEYVAEHFRCNAFLTGFTGSAGHLVVTGSGAWFFTDGRYFIQAANQLSGSGIELMKMGEPGVPEVDDFIAQKMSEVLKENDSLAFGFDGNVVNTKAAKGFIDKIEKTIYKKVTVKSDRDFAGEMWTDRPAQNFTPLWSMDLKYTGETTQSKLDRIRAKLRKFNRGEDNYLYLLNSLDDIAWTFNIRAADVNNNPVAFAYAAIMSDKAILFTYPGMVSDELKAALAAEGVSVGEYSMKSLCIENGGQPVLMDESRIGYNIYRFYQNNGAAIVNVKNPSTPMKGEKNETELACAKAALVRDSAVLIRFMYWLKKKSAEAGPGAVMKNDDGTDMTELSVDTYLTGLRKEDPLFFSLSFNTIAAYGENAALMHYMATPEKHSKISAKGMLLVDSGGQYYDGTTDITRTFVLGELTEDEIKSFTLTAASMLRLLNTKFIYGCSGEILDIMAREPMWKEGLDYKCGTGHGIGHVLNVHEGPHNIRWRIGPDGPTAVLETGMVVSNEPGVYKEGLYGIRTENEMFVKPYMSTPDGQFMQFENMTFIPIDLDGIDKKYLSQDDVKMLNEYHRQVFETVSPLLDEEVKAWLKEYTREI